MKRKEKLIGLFMVLFAMISVNAWAGQTTRYARIKAETQNGGGTVYASTTETSSPKYAETSTSETASQRGTGDSQSIQFHLYAQENDGYVFSGWKNNNNPEDKNYLSTDKHYAPNITATSKTEAAPTEETWYAIFKKLHTYNIKVTADIIGNGQVYVGENASNVTYSSEKITTVDSQEKKTETPNAKTYYWMAKTITGYTFQGWYRDEAGTDLLTSDAIYSESVNYEEDNTVEKVYYAKFVEITNTKSVDLTSKIVNPGFESSTWNAGWTTEGFVEHENAGQFGGAHIAEMYESPDWGRGETSGSIKQTISNLPVGCYRLTAKATGGVGKDASSGNGDYLYVKVGSSDAVKTFVPNTTDVAYEYSVDFILDNESNIEIGFERINSMWWSAVDDFTLTYYDPVVEETITLAEACTDGERYYGTYSNSSAFIVPEDLTVAVVAVDGDGKLVVNEYNEGDVVAANTGVMVSSETAGDHSITLTNAKADELPGGNNLHPSSEPMSGDNLFYRLTMHNGTQIGYWWGAENGASFTIAANKAYLAVPKSNQLVKSSVWVSDEETSIEVPAIAEEDNIIYNLAGQRVNTLTKGIYIKNGKKFYVK